MNLLDPRSLAVTIDRVNACFFAGETPGRRQSSATIDWILTRFAAPTAYGRTFGVTALDESNRLHTFTGEPLTSRASLRHILAEETCRALILLNRVARRKLPELDAASADLRERITRWESQGNPVGMYCCGPCSVGLWRHLAVGGLGVDAGGLDQRVGVLRQYRDREGSWGRFPFYYTLAALAEADGPNTRAEIDHARPACERRLQTTRKSSVYGARRRMLLERILSRAP